MCHRAESQRMEPASQKMVPLYSSIHLLFDWTFCILNSSCSATHGYYDALAWWEIMKVMGFYSITLQRRRPHSHLSLHQLACMWGGTYIKTIFLIQFNDIHSSPGTPNMITRVKCNLLPPSHGQSRLGFLPSAVLLSHTPLICIGLVSSEEFHPAFLRLPTRSQTQHGASWTDALKHRRNSFLKQIFLRSWSEVNIMHSSQKRFLGPDFLVPRREIGTWTSPKEESLGMSIPVSAS